MGIGVGRGLEVGGGGGGGGGERRVCLQGIASIKCSLDSGDAAWT